VSVGYTMIPSLAHLSVLAIPHGVSLSATQEVVLKYILSDSRRQMSNALFKGRKLNSEFCIRRIKYEDSLKCGTGNDSDIMNICEELRVLFDNIMEFRNTMSSHGLWSSNYVYMDWLISSVLFSPPRSTEAEEIYHMLSSSTTMWTKISPQFDVDSYTATERELCTMIMQFRVAIFRSLATLDRSRVTGIDDIQKLALPLIDISTQERDNDQQKIFFRNLISRLEKHVPYYYTLEEGEIPP
jgi:hypothetical protein